jgi:hypothetical protein
MAGNHSYIKLIVKTPDGTRSESTIKAPHVTEKMFQAAYELLYTLRCGEICPRAESKKAAASLYDKAKKARK